MINEELFITGANHGAHDGDDASDCLNALLEHRVKDDLMLGNLLAYTKRDRFGQAEDRTSLNRKLQTLGIKPEKDGVLITNSHRGLTEVFRGTIWEAGGWNSSLGRLPSAEKTKQRRFGDHRGEAVWLPASAIPEDYDDGHELPIDHF